MSETSQLIIPDLVKEGLCNLLANTTNRHAKLLSLHDAKLFSDPFYERIRTLQSENERLRLKLEKSEAVSNIKGEFLRARQCADHSGKWERGRCLQCEIERLRKGLEGLVNQWMGTWAETCAEELEAVLNREIFEERNYEIQTDRQN